VFLNVITEKKYLLMFYMCYFVTEYNYIRNGIVQCVPLATEPGISLIILPLMRILQRNLKRTYLIV
jgi:hypothetical protein